MVRWEPGARARLQLAAMNLYLSQGFEQTTVTEIAESVGLSERTFFRHFADKREVLFDGQDQLKDRFLAGLVAATDDASPIELVAAALDATAAFFPDERRDYSRRRQVVINTHPGLQERELLKLAALATALAEALRNRGVPDPAAALAGESGVTVFAVAFTQWIGEGESQSFGELLHQGLAALRALTR